MGAAVTLGAADVSVALDGEAILWDVSLAVDPGAVLAVVGPSGTGKTTLLRLLGLFRRPDRGTVTWEGEDVWKRSEAGRLAVRRSIGFVFQEPSLFNVSILRNVQYGLRVRRSWPDRIRDELGALTGRAEPHPAVTDALELVGLRDRTSRNALSLSGGEAQRVAFARALAVDPEVLLLDEPTSNLDPRNTALLEGAILRARDRGVGVVVATHDMHQARRVSDRVAVVLGGELVESGPPEQIFDSPADPRTAKFVGGELLYEADSTQPADSPSAGDGD